VTRELKCQGTTTSGEPCKAPGTLVDPETGLCPSHAPGASERLAEAGRRGAEATARRFKAPGLDPSDLGDLESVQDAQRWLRRIGEGVVTGKLRAQEATAGVRAIETWLKAEQDRVASDELAELRAQLVELRESLKNGRRLGVVS
jgi:hypothetical protein